MEEEEIIVNRPPIWDMPFGYAMRVVKRYIWLIAMITIIITGFVAVTGIAKATEKYYYTEVKFYFSYMVQGYNSVGEPVLVTSDPTNFIGIYTKHFTKNQDVLNDVVAHLDARAGDGKNPYTRQSIENYIFSSISGDSNNLKTLTFTVIGLKEEDAKLLMETFIACSMDTIRKEVEEITDFIDQSGREYQLSISEPPTDVKPGVRREYEEQKRFMSVFTNVIVAFFVSMLFSTLCLIVIFNFNGKMKKGDKFLMGYGIPTIGRIPSELIDESKGARKNG